ncbi:MAG: hypothetical protein ABT10_24445 [Novosphingobium sp. SCN 63-17]|nr:MAG: hypothetical protein ABT10_24445 [Novosphingobium sp. SCN 63-17]OJX88259.1 MAG: hypothetical protein BGP00_07675 [Novosphingobium sp. 63-713]
MLESDLLLGSHGLGWEACFQLREEFDRSNRICRERHFPQSEDGSNFQHLEAVALGPSTFS